MDFEKYEADIREKLETELKSILSKKKLEIDELRFLTEIESTIKMKKLTNIL